MGFRSSFGVEQALNTGPQGGENAGMCRQCRRVTLRDKVRHGRNVVIYLFLF